LRTKKGKDGEIHRISFNAFCQIKSAASSCHVLNMQNALPSQAWRDHQGRGWLKGNEEGPVEGDDNRPELGAANMLMGGELGKLEGPVKG